MDIKRGTIDRHLSIRMTRFFMRCIGLWYTDNNRDKIISNAILFYTMCTMIMAFMLVGVDSYFSINDLHVWENIYKIVKHLENICIIIFLVYFHYCLLGDCLHCSMHCCRLYRSIEINNFYYKS